MQKPSRAWGRPRGEGAYAVRGAERLRLTTMLIMLGTLGALVFANRGRGLAPPGVPPQASDAVAPRERVLPVPGPTASVSQTTSGAAVTAGPTDEDPEQWADAADEFQAVADGTVGLQPEDMLAYWRLFFWSEHQSFAALQQRAAQPVLFSDLMQFPDKSRGRLVCLDLNVRRVLAYDVEESPVGVQRVYEVWGWSEDSKAWLYAVVTAHLPDGMAVGAEVYERARFAGYFLKLHGYYEAGAKPRAAPLRAPLLVGRLTRYPAVAPRPAARYEWLTAIAVAGFAVVLVGATVAQWLFHRRTAQRRAAREQQDSARIREWLRTDFAAGGEEPEAVGEADPPNDVWAGNRMPDSEEQR